MHCIALSGARKRHTYTAKHGLLIDARRCNTVSPLSFVFQQARRSLVATTDHTYALQQKPQRVDHLLAFGLALTGILLILLVEDSHVPGALGGLFLQGPAVRLKLGCHLP